MRLGFGSQGGGAEKEEKKKKEEGILFRVWGGSSVAVYVLECRVTVCLC